MIDNEDGTVSYRKPATFGTDFRVRIADVTGFSVSSSGKMLERTLKTLGNGTELASSSVNHGVAEKIEAWIRAHPDFLGNATVAGGSDGSRTPGSGSVAEELTKLAALRDAGVLTEEEFAHQKARLLS